MLCPAHINRFRGFVLKKPNRFNRLFDEWGRQLNRLIDKLGERCPIDCSGIAYRWPRDATSAVPLEHLGSSSGVALELLLFPGAGGFGDGVLTEAVFHVVDGFVETIFLFGIVEQVGLHGFIGQFAEANAH